MSKLVPITVCLGVGVFSTACAPTPAYTPDCAPMATFAEATPAEKTASVERRIKMILVEQLRVSPEQIVATARLIDDLGADSLDTAILGMIFEEEFCVEIPDQDAEKIETVGDAVAYFTRTARR